MELRSIAFSTCMRTAHLEADARVSGKKHKLPSILAVRGRDGWNHARCHPPHVWSAYAAWTGCCGPAWRRHTAARGDSSVSASALQRRAAGRRAHGQLCAQWRARLALRTGRAAEDICHGCARPANPHSCQDNANLVNCLPVHLSHGQNRASSNQICRCCSINSFASAQRPVSFELANGMCMTGSGHAGLMYCATPTCMRDNTQRRAGCRMGILEPTWPEMRCCGSWQAARPAQAGATAGTATARPAASYRQPAPCLATCASAWFFDESCFQPPEGRRITRNFSSGRAMRMHGCMCTSSVQM